MKNTNRGGFAFPVAWRGADGDLISSGMTLRDYFAASAPKISEQESMREVIASGVKINNYASPEGIEATLKIDCARRYRYADAMLDEREKTK